MRELTLVNYGCQCALCDVKARELLVAGHIVPWPEGPDARGDLANIICLCRFHDPLFELGYWSLRTDFGVPRRAALYSETMKALLSERLAFRKSKTVPPDGSYLMQHRLKHGFST